MLSNQENQVTTTAYRYFEENLTRAHKLEIHAEAQVHSLRSDLYKSAWMSTVDSREAYLCYEYANILAKILLVKSYQSNIKPKNKISSISVYSVHSESAKQLETEEGHERSC